MLKVNDIMSRPVHVLALDMTLDDAAWQLAECRQSGAPVIDQKGRAVGVISKTDLVNRGPGAGSSSIRDAMSPLVFWVRPEDDAMQAVRLMVTERIHRVIVLSGDGHPAGIVTSMDILKALEGGAELSDGRDAPPRRHGLAAQAIPDGWVLPPNNDFCP